MAARDGDGSAVTEMRKMMLHDRARYYLAASPSKTFLTSSPHTRYIDHFFVENATTWYSQRSTITARESVIWWAAPVERLVNCQGNPTNQNYWLKKLYAFNI